MDPITHAFTGCLLGKSYFDKRMGRVGIFAVTLGAVFPDVDVFATAFDHDPLGLIKHHRTFTHSLAGMVVFSIVLAGLTALWVRRKGRAGPGFGALVLAYGVGIGSHLVLDLCTSFGTCVLDPFSYARFSWDLLFIVDFLFMGILLAPQLVAWAYRDAARTGRRTAGCFAGMAAGTLGMWRIAGRAGFPFHFSSAVILVLLLAAVFFGPRVAGWGWDIPRRRWCRAGVYAACAYLLAAYGAHHDALARVRAFAAQRNLQVVRSAAIPLPPSMLSWDGLILTDTGVWRTRFALRTKQTPEWSFFADSPPSKACAEALELPDVQTYLWFARFPVVQTFEQNGNSVVDFLDLRFSMRRQQGPRPFTFRVILDPQGRLIEDDWVVGASGIRRGAVKVLIFSDIHGDWKALEEMMARPADVWIAAGDLTTFGRSLGRAGEILAARGEKAWVLPGNHETAKDIRELCAEFGLTDFHRHVRRLGTSVWAGLGYSNPTPFNTPGEYTEDELAEALAELERAKPQYVVAHCPPQGTAVDEIAPGRHAGSMAVRQWAERAQPAYLFCGHIHEAAGKRARLGATECVNVGKKGYTLELADGAAAAATSTESV
jgi:uncharacterized protein